AAAVGGLDAAHAARTLREGEEVHVNVDGHDHALGPDDVQMVLQPLEGYQLERSGTHAVALDTVLDDELRLEGLAREVVHAVQNARKEAGLDVEDRIALALGGDDGLLEAVRAHEVYVTGETLATSLQLMAQRGKASMPERADNAAKGDVAQIDGRDLRIAVSRA
ncbi:MAG: DUF5915 domain-containing protein, partial [Thermoleophilaceae bacterium]